MKIARIATAAVLGVALTLGAGLPAQAAPVARAAKVTLVADTDGVSTVTWSANGVVAQNERTKKWVRSFKRESFTYYSVTVTSSFGDDGANRVGCKIKVNGKTVRNKSVKGQFASVSCSYVTR